MSITWYIKRARTFSLAEIFYRVRQRIQTHLLDKWTIRWKSKNFESNICLNSRIIENPTMHFAYPIFGKPLDIFKPINWHLDLESKKSFPERFAHFIDIRSDEFGSAKNVWEVNRQLFLVHLATLYEKTFDEKYLDLIFYHLASWKKNNPYLLGVNWYSNIEINIRLINWAYCWKILNVDRLCKTSQKVNDFVRTIWMPMIEEHVEYSYRHPSFYSSANNHLIAEYAGLFVACCLWPKLPKTGKYRAYAQAGLETEIIRQNSADGINREEAAEYIQFIDDFFLIAAVIGKNFGHSFSKIYLERLHQMAHYLNQMLDVNGNYPMYGDGDDGFVLCSDAGGPFNNFVSLLASFSAFFKDEKLKRFLVKWDAKCELLLGKEGWRIFDSLTPRGEPLESRFYAQSGHYIFRKRESAKEIYLHFDAAPLGFLSIAAHGHADALSILLNIDGKPILVDSGTYTYHTEREWRRYFVGTLAHNTVCVNGRNQACFSGPTMWTKHFQCRNLAVDTEHETVVAAHNGYETEGVSHVRKVCFEREKNLFLIEDTLKGKDFSIEMPFHLHPNVQVQSISDGFLLSSPGARSVLILTDPQLQYEIISGQNQPILGWYSEHFGKKQATFVLYAKRKCAKSVRFVTKIQVLDD